MVDEFVDAITISDISKKNAIPLSTLVNANENDHKKANGASPRRSDDDTDSDDSDSDWENEVDKLEYAKENLRNKLEGIRETYERKFEKKTLHEQQQYRLHAAVVSAATVEEKTFTDMVFKITNVLIENVQEWVRNKLFTNEYIREHAKEDANVSRRRVVLQDTLNKMNSCLDKISSII